MSAPAAPVANVEGAPPEAPVAQPQTARHGGSAKARSAHPAAPVTNIEGEPSATLAAQRQTARHGGSAKVRSAHPSAHIGNSKGEPSAPPAAQPQTARHGGSVAGSRGAHADGGTRHRASSRRWHRAIFPGRGVGSRGATVGRPSAHCASPGRHSGPRSSPPDRAPPRAHLPQPRTAPDARNEQPVRRKAHPPQVPTHRAPPRAHPTQPRAQTAGAHRPFGERRIEEIRRHYLRQ